MYAALTLSTLLSVILALSGSGSVDVAQKKATDQDQLQLNKDTTSGGFLGTSTGTTSSPRGVNLNHNETLVLDYRSTTIGGCSPMVCGVNHNETLVRDAALSHLPDYSDRWIGENEMSAIAPFLIQLAYSSFLCSLTVCGTNHNETLGRDTAKHARS